MRSLKRLARTSGALALASLMATTAQGAIDPNDAAHNLLLNGDFAKTTANWTNSNGWGTGANTMAITNPNGAYCVAITNKASGAQRWDFALRQQGLKLEAGHVYTVKGKVWALTTAPAIYMGIDLTADPYTNFKSASVIPPVATSAPTTNNLTMSYTAAATTSGVHFGFQLGDLPLNTTVCFDDLVVYDPQYTAVVATPPNPVVVNQVGYLTGLNKMATYVVPKTATDKTTARSWKLKQGSTLITSGTATASVADAASNETIQTIDFSKATATGTGFTLEVTEGSITNISRSFSINNDLYKKLKYDALAYFYHNRSNTPIDSAVVGATFARGAGHTYDKTLSTKDGSRTNVDVAGGWYDAGDHGKYVVNGGIAVWTLLNQYERAKYLGANAGDFADGTMKLPASETTDSIPDILNEAKWEIEWMLKMQIPSGPDAGYVYHKLHDDSWTATAFNPANATAAANPRHIWATSTAATFNLAAVGAQCYRTYKNVDPTFANKCLNAAVAAYAAGKKDFRPAPTTLPTDGGGAYPDTNVTDEKYWAATELYLATNDPAETTYDAQAYANDMAASGFHLQSQLPTVGKAGMAWQGTAGLGVISLATAGNAFGANTTWVNNARSAITTTANSFATNTESSFGTPFSSSSTSPVSWGSNSDVLNNIIVMGLARDFSCPSGVTNTKLSNGIQNAMNYVLGRNPMDFSYVTGYGSHPLTKPHHRFWAFIGASPAGVVVGGANQGKEDAEAQANLAGCTSLECYLDNVEAFSTNEITINWNSPLAWASAYLDEMGSGRKPQSCGGINATGGTITITTGVTGTIDLKTLNSGQTGDVYTIVTQPTKGTVTITNGVATYTGGSTFTTSDIFTYKITRGGVDSAPATITVTKTAPTTASCDTKVTYDTNIYNNSWQGQLIIQNTTAAAITSWSVDLQYDSSTKLGAWGNPGTFDADFLDLGGNKYRLTNKAWNGNIPVGSSLVIGLNGTAGTVDNVSSTPAGKPVISGTTCGTSLPKSVRFHSIHQNSIIYGTDAIGRFAGTNIQYFNSSSTPDDNLIFKIDNNVIADYIHMQNCCRGSLFLEQRGITFGNHTMTLSSGSSSPQETDTVNFLFTNAKATCAISNVVQNATNWTATVKVTNEGYHPGSISGYYFEPARATDVVYRGINWTVSLNWAEDYPAVAAKGVKRNIVSTDGKTRIKEDLTYDGFNNPWYNYYIAASDFKGELLGRPANGTPASISFNIKGDGTFMLTGNKQPQMSCNFGLQPWF